MVSYDISAKFLLLFRVSPAPSLVQQLIPSLSPHLQRRLHTCPLATHGFRRLDRRLLRMRSRNMALKSLPPFRFFRHAMVVLRGRHGGHRHGEKDHQKAGKASHWCTPESEVSIFFLFFGNHTDAVVRGGTGRYLRRPPWIRRCRLWR